MMSVVFETDAETKDDGTLMYSIIIVYKDNETQTLISSKNKVDICAKWTKLLLILEKNLVPDFES